MATYRKTLLSMVSLLALAAALGAQAQPVGPRGPVPFKVLDQDGNGYVSSQEFDRHRADRMAGRAAQGRLMRNAGQAPSFEAWDRDGDGALTPAELASGQQARFAARTAGGRPCWRNR